MISISVTQKVNLKLAALFVCVGQVRKTSQAALLVLLEQEVVERGETDQLHNVYILSIFGNVALVSELKQTLGSLSLSANDIKIGF